jgi:hypothetical protein
MSPAAVRVERLGGLTGVYDVTFDRNVAGCAYSVTPVDTITMVSADAVPPIEGKPNTVNVQFNEWVDPGEPPLRSTQFSIAVFC